MQNIPQSEHIWNAINTQATGIAKFSAVLARAAFGTHLSTFRANLHTIGAKLQTVAAISAFLTIIRTIAARITAELADIRTFLTEAAIIADGATF